MSNDLTEKQDELSEDCCTHAFPQLASSFSPSSPPLFPRMEAHKKRTARAPAHTYHVFHTCRKGGGNCIQNKGRPSLPLPCWHPPFWIHFPSHCLHVAACACICERVCIPACVSFLFFFLAPPSPPVYVCVWSAEDFSCRFFFSSGASGEVKRREKKALLSLSSSSTAAAGAGMCSLCGRLLPLQLIAMTCVGVRNVVLKKKRANEVWPISQDGEERRREKWGTK